MTQDPSPARVRLRLVFSPDFALGPGKADLLEGIAETGSIAAAGRASCRTIFPPHSAR